MSSRLRARVPGQGGCFRHVRGDESGARKEARAIEVYRFRLQQDVAACRHHDRINNERNFSCRYLENVGNGFDNLSRAKQASLDRSHRKICEAQLDLFAHTPRVNRVDPRNFPVPP